VQQSSEAKRGLHLLRGKEKHVLWDRVGGVDDVVVGVVDTVVREQALEVAHPSCLALIVPLA
jgi:hypothetical protein